MATRLSKAEGFSGLWKEMVVRANFTFYEVTLDKIKRADKQLSKDLKYQYGRFFIRIAVDFLGRYSGTGKGPTFGRESAFPTWQRLSHRWLAYKEEEGDSNKFYTGVSNVEGRVRNRRDGTKTTIKVTENFRDYMKSLKPDDVEYAMGKLIIEYTFRTKNKKFATTDIQNTHDLAQKVTKTQSDEFPDQLLITAEIKAFQNMAGLKQDEWDIVDKIIVELGYEEQWRKINATKFGRSGRPIRAVVGPMMQRFMSDTALPALKQFNETLR